MNKTTPLALLRLEYDATPETRKNCVSFLRFISAISLSNGNLSEAAARADLAKAIEKSEALDEILEPEKILTVNMSVHRIHRDYSERGILHEIFFDADKRQHYRFI